MSHLSASQRETQWLYNVEDAQQDILVYDTGAVAGFCSCGRQRDDDLLPDSREFFTLYVLPEHWGQGLGRALIKEARLLQ